ncbi:MAG: helix-turn-helix transcriptional regulator [Caldisericia bacterium]|jgi:transcriptional regulator with XRE-family HTH domain|nr:helix-turn-helix transcriptional regulator [Caldisericia bacterium]
MHFGQKIKELRETEGLLQRQLAASLEIDTPMYSKIERGERKAKRRQVVLLSKLLNFKEDELLTIWLADQVYDLVANDNNAHKALKLVENQLKHKR